LPSEVTPTVVPGKSRGPTTRERMELYSRFASDLACESSQRALRQSGIDPQQITHLVVVTCTGFDAPGVDIELIERLGLPNTTQRIQVGFMGCHGAINGMRAGLAICESDPKARVLLCAVELCSLHYRFTWDSEGIIGNALFADGSAAMVLGNAPQTHTGDTAAPWQIVDTGSVVIADSKQTMSWSIGDNGFDMRLTSDVGDKIEQQLAAWLTVWLASHGLDVGDIDYWGVHPGGPRIVSAVKNSMQLSDEDLATSRSVLQRHGNMSSPTVLFILQEFQKRHASVAGRNCVLLGFGPGLVAEIALLKTPA
jgi:alkylresorcinol/alkylpyrone synthase